MSSSIEIEASRARIWEVLTSARRWPEWARVCSEVWESPTHGDWAVGQKLGFRLRMAGRQVPFNVTIQRYEPEALISWSSTKFSITAIRTISVVAGEDSCEVTDKKHFKSPLLPIGIVYPRWLVRRMTDSWLLDLRSESERSE